MSSPSSTYLHGYSPEEQARLVAQATYWRERAILPGLEYRAGERVLDIGCGVGAVLGVLVEAFPGLEVSGIDLEARQVEAARAHLARLGHGQADLRVGSALALPWEAESFDHVFVMWLLEHLREPERVLAEAFRVLRPGGTIALQETDYSTFRIHPESPDFDALAAAQYDWFARHGGAFVGRVLGPLLRAAGFVAVENRIAGFHYFQDESELLRQHVDYVATFLEMSVEGLARDLGRDEAVLRRGCAHLRSLADHPGGAITQVLYRARARRP